MTSVDSKPVPTSSPETGTPHNTTGSTSTNGTTQNRVITRKRAPRLRALDALLDSYEEERLPLAAEMLGLSTHVHRGEVRRGEATQQLGLGYRGSSLAVETRTGLPEYALRAGDRAPDGTRGSVRLFDTFRGPHWTLLAVGTEVELPLLEGDLVRTVRVPAYEAYGSGVFLVRPDGYVGWAGETAEGLAEYAVCVGALG